MQSDEIFHNRQAETKAAVTSRLRRVLLSKAIKDVRKKFRRNPPRCRSR
jgi:hypothetical protein